MSKKENRLKKLEEKQAKDKKKKAILIAVVVPEKSPIIQQSVSPRKMPKEIDGESYMNKKMEWSREREDREGVWSWGLNRDWGEETWDSLLEPFLKTCGNKKWSEIRAERNFNKKGGHYKHIYYQIEKLKKEAIERLYELEQDDQDRIFRFRLGSSKRLYGFVINQVFGTIWYDPTHDIYDD